MVTLVLDEQGNTLHDCAREGCAVSWDGFALRPLELGDLYPDPVRRPPSARPLAKGERVPNAEDPSPQVWTLRGPSVRLKRLES